jgi:hypothetical protein
MWASWAQWLDAVEAPRALIPPKRVTSRGPVRRVDPEFSRLLLPSPDARLRSILSAITSRTGADFRRPVAAPTPTAPATGGSAGQSHVPQRHGMGPLPALPIDALRRLAGALGEIDSFASAAAAAGTESAAATGGSGGASAGHLEDLVLLRATVEFLTLPRVRAIVGRRVWLLGVRALMATRGATTLASGGGGGGGGGGDATNTATNTASGANAAAGAALATGAPWGVGGSTSIADLNLVGEMAVACGFDNAAAAHAALCSIGPRSPHGSPAAAPGGASGSLLSRIFGRSSGGGGAAAHSGVVGSGTAGSRRMSTDPSLVVERLPAARAEFDDAVSLLFAMQANEDPSVVIIPAAVVRTWVREAGF